MPDLTATQRMQRILELLETSDGVRVSDLADAFSVSEVTPRHETLEDLFVREAIET